MTGTVNQFIPAAQRRVEDLLALFEKNNRTGADLIKKAIDAAQSGAARLTTSALRCCWSPKTSKSCWR